MTLRRPLLRPLFRPLLRPLFASFAMTACLGTASAATPEQARDFQRAVQMDDTRTVKNLLGAGVDPNEQAAVGGEPALVLAVREGSMNVFRALLAHPGVKLDAPAVNGNTALMMAAFKHNAAAAEALIAKGAAVNREGWTPLHYAAASGDNDIARLLLQRGAKIDAVSPRASGAYTPLMMAAREGHEESALFLIAQGANPRLKNSEGLTAAQIAARAGHDTIATAIDAHTKTTR